ncbi:hypothetical protein AVEN_200266-1 [Araneus ventricosus]|uniref:Uncharacterized protein n=1 Tax=Araneus ventricosus TaxID=182803 RepID=A0A4Y2DUH2_ARAVE|nr:hypothetical protein AVEN_200266-1 [Araneus ventricosus]
MPKPQTRTPAKERKKSPQQEENTIEVIAGLTDIKDSLEALLDLKYLIQEFPTIIEATKKCKQVKTKEEKVMIVLNSLLGV